MQTMTIRIPQPGTPATEQRLLVVGGDSVIRDLLTVLLKQQGFKVDCVRDLAAGADALRARQYAAVFIDTRWHGAEPGKLMLNLDRGHTRPLIVFVADRNDTSVQREIRAAGADALITRPFDREDLEPVLQLLRPSAEPAGEGDRNAHVLNAGVRHV